MGFFVALASERLLEFDLLEQLAGDDCRAERARERAAPRARLVVAHHRPAPNLAPRRAPRRAPRIGRAAVERGAAPVVELRAAAARLAARKDLGARVGRAEEAGRRLARAERRAAVVRVALDHAAHRGAHKVACRQGDSANRTDTGTASARC